MDILAHAGLSDYSPEEWRQALWLLLGVATVLPACLFAFTGALHPLFIVLSAGQTVGMFFALRAVFRFFRRRRHSELAVGGWLMLAYFPLCLATNAVFALLFSWAAAFLG